MATILNPIAASQPVGTQNYYTYTNNSPSTAVNHTPS